MKRKKWFKIKHNLHTLKTVSLISISVVLEKRYPSDKKSGGLVFNDHATVMTFSLNFPAKALPEQVEVPAY
jgi:hypothetical protein